MHRVFEFAKNDDVITSTGIE